MKIVFVEDADVVTENGKETLFKKGQKKDLPEASAQRWIRRGIAVSESDAKAAEEASKKAAAEAKEKEKADEAAAKEKADAEKKEQ